MKKVVWFVALMAFFGLVVWPAVKTHVLVRRIECFTQYGSCPDTYFAKLQKFTNYSLALPLPVRQIRGEMQSFSEIKKLDLYRRLPETLVVSVTVRRPLSAISNTVLGWQSGFDSEGRIFPVDPSSPLPLIISPQIYHLGDQVGPNLIAAAGFLNNLLPLVSSRLIGQVDGNELRFSVGSTQVLVDLINSPSNWPSSLQSILNRSKIGANYPKIIDLRFSQPVLTY